jgi:hypothetical protein
MSDFLIPAWAQPRAVYTQLITPPTEEPLTVEEAKTRAAMSWPTTIPPDPRDQMTADFIRTARAKVELDTGLALLTQTRIVTFMLPASLELPQIMPLPANCTPLQSISDVPARAIRERMPGTGRLTISGLMFTTPLEETVVECVAGWPSVEALKAEAPGLVQAVGLLVAHYLTLGRDLAISGSVAYVNTVPEGYEALIEPYRLIWVV